MLWKVFDKAIPQFLLFSLEQRATVKCALVLFWDPSCLRRKQEARALLSAFKALGHLVFFFLFPFAIGSDLPNCKWLCDTLFPEFLVWQFGCVWLCQCVRGNSYQKKCRFKHLLEALEAALQPLVLWKILTLPLIPLAFATIYTASVILQKKKIPHSRVPT